MQSTQALAETREGGVGVRTKEPSAQRFLPLDAFRGFIMIMLVSDGLGLRALWKHPVFHGIGEQFDHVPWVGTHFYDLIAPAFLLMVGMSMPYSLGRRTAEGATFGQNFRHMGMRCLRLMLLSRSEEHTSELQSRQYL